MKHMGMRYTPNPNMDQSGVSLKDCMTYRQENTGNGIAGKNCAKSGAKKGSGGTMINHYVPNPNQS